MKVAIVFALAGVLSSIGSGKCLPLFGRTLLSGREEQPLMALSLESSETVPDVAEEPLSGSGRDTSRRHWDANDFHRSHDQLLRYMSTTSERFYDIVLGVLQVLESQARQEVQRARLQLEATQLATDGSDEELST